MESPCESYCQLKYLTFFAPSRPMSVPVRLSHRGCFGSLAAVAVEMTGKSALPFSGTLATCKPHGPCGTDFSGVNPGTRQ